LHALGAPLPAPASQLKVSGRRYSRARDQAVIAGHYELPSEFYRLIPGPRMAEQGRMGVGQILATRPPH